MLRFSYFFSNSFPPAHRAQCRAPIGRGAFFPFPREKKTPGPRIVFEGERLAENQNLEIFQRRGKTGEKLGVLTHGATVQEFPSENTLGVFLKKVLENWSKKLVIFLVYKLQIRSLDKVAYKSIKIIP